MLTSMLLTKICKSDLEKTADHCNENSYIHNSKYVFDWLKPHTIHHNQLLLTKFGTGFVILNQRPQKCNPLQIIELLTEKRPGDKVVLVLVRGKTKIEMAKLL